MTFKRKIKRGRIKKAFNSALNRIVYYRKTSRGNWVLFNPFNNHDYIGATQLSNQEISKIEI